MKKIIYLLVSAAMLAVTAACGKQPSPDKDPETMTISIVPEFEMDVDVKSVELGRTDIWCYVFDWDTKMQVEGSPVKQSEINGNVYSYQVPKCENAYVHFVIRPENSTWTDRYLSHNENVIDCNDSFVSTVETEIYASNRPSWTDGSHGIWVNSADSGTDTYTIEMYQLHRKMHLMFTFTNMPEGVTAESLIKNIHLKAGDIELDGTLDLSDMTVENESLTDWDNTMYKWYTKDIYMYFGYDYRQIYSDYRKIDLMIETTDNRIYRAEDIWFNYAHNEKMKITIDYDYIRKANE